MNKRESMKVKDTSVNVGWYFHGVVSKGNIQQPDSNIFYRVHSAYSSPLAFSLDAIM